MLIAIEISYNCMYIVIFPNVRGILAISSVGVLGQSSLAFQVGKKIKTRTKGFFRLLQTEGGNELANCYNSTRVIKLPT